MNIVLYNMKGTREGKRKTKINIDEQGKDIKERQVLKNTIML